jgi:hypothetical protein
MQAQELDNRKPPFRTVFYITVETAAVSLHLCIITLVLNNKHINMAL